MSSRWMKRQALILHGIKGRQSNNNQHEPLGETSSGFLMRKSKVIEVARYIHFTEEQKELARNKSIVNFLRRRGEKVKSHLNFRQGTVPDVGPYLMYKNVERRTNKCLLSTVQMEKIVL
ncbi:MAG: hypothetical protein UHS49_00310 [Faecalimonas sp.]|nr:hypothetical protein [Faecalimonas sp.]